MRSRADITRQPLDSSCAWSVFMLVRCRRIGICYASYKNTDSITSASPWAQVSYFSHDHHSTELDRHSKPLLQWNAHFDLKSGPRYVHDRGEVVRERRPKNYY